MSTNLHIVEQATKSATVAGLRYVTDARPGITRRRAGQGFVFIDPEGMPIRDREEVRRIKALVIPPAWTSVWICPRSNGHLQATGRDSKGRKQYLYHKRWREIRDESKYNRLVPFGESLSKIRRRVGRDLRLPGLPRDKVLATVVKLLDKARIRVGNDQYARENGSFGLTTLRNRHVNVAGSNVRFEFKGKSGKQHSVGINDQRLARIIRQCQEIPGYELFQYKDDSGEYQSIDSSDVNDYLREITSEEFSAKDFRTWSGTVAAAATLRELGSADSVRQAKKNITEAISTVAEFLGNTPSVCRKCYIHPDVIEAYCDGSLERLMSYAPGSRPRRSYALNAEETGVLNLLKYRQRTKDHIKKAA
ncbi:MAG TPA: DNA topoisomerase IB [Blastocatellia bacterium]|nr:DNA topoisomerase IB [Blastocatellia bacterium]